nr:hypothetical protein Iba_chr04fCG15610 [Ipomoea batatas]
MERSDHNNDPLQMALPHSCIAHHREGPSALTGQRARGATPGFTVAALDTASTPGLFPTSSGMPLALPSRTVTRTDGTRGRSAEQTRRGRAEWARVHLQYSRVGARSQAGIDAMSPGPACRQEAVPRRAVDEAGRQPPPDASGEIEACGTSDASASRHRAPVSRPKVRWKRRKEQEGEGERWRSPPQVAHEGQAWHAGRVKAKKSEAGEEVTRCAYKPDRIASHEEKQKESRVASLGGLGIVRCARSFSKDSGESPIGGDIQPRDMKRRRGKGPVISHNNGTKMPGRRERVEKS